jgi:hypothetical protein
VLWLVVFAASMLGYFQLVKTSPLDELEIAQQALPTQAARSQLELPTNPTEALMYWRPYWEGISEDPRSLLFGHADRPNRETAPSAHNYYLDLVYNFGAVALVPWLFLFYRSAKLAWSAIRSRSATTDILWLLGAIAFFALVDNSLKVAFRQPYPGILMLFLWGVLLARLSAAVAAPRA